MSSKKLVQFSALNWSGYWLFIQAIEGARIQGASKIIGVDLINLKAKKGTAFGMTDFINPKESGKSISELVKEATGGLGVDYCFECTGVPSLLSEAIESTKVVRLYVTCFSYIICELEIERDLAF